MREIQRQSRLAASTIQEELRKLVKMELLERRKDGNRIYFKANPNHPLFPEIQGLVLKTVGLVDVIRDALKDDGIRLAFVFGSVAASEEKASSDIDLMVLGSIGLRKLTVFLSGVGERLEREINPHVMTLQEFKTRLAQNEHFVSRRWQAPRIFIVGSENEFRAMAQRGTVSNC
ncbi:MAG: toxin-antitoxin system toxin subunit [Candidatus Aureabacteria bacterium]|nr:toxin-antitoxin system toxin subunit [Candidatus Auribacterota bacterium]